MNYQMNQGHEMELDLKELLWKLLTQWKAVVLVSLLMALIICGTKHNRDVQNYMANADALNKAASQTSLSQDERIDAVLETLPEDERDNVVLIVSEKEWLANQKSYIDESIIMQTDPANQRVLRLVYDIDSANTADLPVLVHNYSAYLYSDAVIGEIKNCIDPSAENRYIGELFFEEDDENSAPKPLDTESGALEVNLVLPENADADAVAKIITDAFVTYSKKLNSKYSHTIAEAGKDDIHIYHEDNANRKRDLYGSIYDMENMLKSDVISLSEKQNMAVEAILNIKGEGAEPESAVEPVNVVLPGFSKKMAVLGFVIGIVLYAFIYVIIVILSGRFNSAKEVESFTLRRILGELYYRTKRSVLGWLIHSSAVEKLHYGDRINITAQTDQFKKALYAICEHENVGEVTLINTSRFDEAAGILGKIVTDKENAIKMNIVEIKDQFEEKKLLPVRNGVLAVGNDTKGSDLRRIANLCSDYDISILGNIYIELI